MNYEQKTVNDFGLNEIHVFLANNHKLGRAHFTKQMLKAWASEAEFSLSEGNDAGIELKAIDSINGCTQTFTISDLGLDVEIVEIDE